MISITFYDLFVYGLLTFALIALWLPKTIDRLRIRLWHILCAAAMGGGLLFGYIHSLGLISMVLLAVSCYLAGSEQRAKIVRLTAGLVMFVVSVGLSLHIIPGFSNPKIVTDVILSQDGIPYSKYLNFDKTMVGLFVLGFTFHNLLSTLPSWRSMLKKALPVAGLTIGVIMLMSFALGYVRFDPKWPSVSFFWLWAWTNLFFTCIAEETVFRGIMQRYLVTGLSRFQHGTVIGLAIAAIVFGIMHYPGGIKYMILSSAAGIGYGWTYLRTNQIEASILTHFILNTIHFCFFTYPALAYN